MNSLNVNQIEGGTQIKQGDSESVFAFELLDENFEPIALDGKLATIKLVSSSKVGYETTNTVSDNKVQWTIDKVLPTGSYVLEIIVDGYVFPSDRQTRIHVIKSVKEYTQAELVTSPTELILERLNVLENKEDKDTIYNDEELREGLRAVNERISNLVDNDTIYDDTEVRNNIRELSERLSHLVNYDDTQLKASVTELETNKADKTSVSAVEGRVHTLEADQPKLARQESLELTQKTLLSYSSRQKDAEARITALENKPDKDTVYDDSYIRYEILNASGTATLADEKIMDYMSENVSRFERYDNLEQNFAQAQSDTANRLTAINKELATLKSSQRVSDNLQKYYLTMVKADAIPQNTKNKAASARDWNRVDNKARRVLTLNKASGFGIIHLDFGSPTSELVWKDTAILAELPADAPTPLATMEVQLAVDPTTSIYIEAGTRTIKGTYPANKRIMCDLVGFFDVSV